MYSLGCKCINASAPLLCTQMHDRLLILYLWYLQPQTTGKARKTRRNQRVSSESRSKPSENPKKLKKSKIWQRWAGCDIHGPYSLPLIYVDFLVFWLQHNVSDSKPEYSIVYHTIATIVCYVASWCILNYGSVVYDNVRIYHIIVYCMSVHYNVLLEHNSHKVWCSTML